MFDIQCFNNNVDKRFNFFWCIAQKQGESNYLVEIRIGANSYEIILVSD